MLVRCETKFQLDLTKNINLQQAPTNKQKYENNGILSNNKGLKPKLRMHSSSNSSTK